MNNNVPVQELSFSFGELCDGAVDIDPPVLLVPLDGVNLSRGLDPVGAVPSVVAVEVRGGAEDERIGHLHVGHVQLAGVF